MRVAYKRFYNLFYSSILKRFILLTGLAAGSDTDVCEVELKRAGGEDPARKVTEVSEVQRDSTAH